MFDIAQLDIVSTSEEGFDVQIVNPKTQEATGIVVKVQGAFSARFQELMAKQKKKEALRAKSPVARAVSEDEDETAVVLSEAAINWGDVDDKGEFVWGVIFEKGTPVKFGKAEALRVFEKYPLIRGQVLSGALDVANFIKG